MRISIEAEWCMWCIKAIFLTFYRIIMIITSTKNETKNVENIAEETDLFNKATNSRIIL